MTITVGIDTYISLDDARAYVTANGLAPLPVDDTDAENLLKQATTALDRLYGNKYLGQKSSMTQPLAWPRIVTMTPIPYYAGEWPYVTYDSFGNPRDFSGLQPETGYAQIELAKLIQASVDIYAQPAPRVIESRNKVATLEQAQKFAGSQGYSEDSTYKVGLVLAPILRNAGASIPITRGA